MQIASEPKGTTYTTRRISGSRRLRILHIFNYLGLGGTELAALRVITNLDLAQFENAICPVSGFDPEIAAKYHPGIAIVPLAKQGSLTHFFSLLDVIKNYKPDVVHSRNWGTIESVPAAWLARVPGVIHSEHGYEMETLTGLPRRRRIFRRGVYGLADVIFTVTDELRQFHMRQAWLSPGRIRVIPNGVDTKVFAPRPQVKKSIREKLGLPAERLVIGSCGRMVPIKNHIALLQAAEMLLQRDVDVHILLVGSGPELQRYQRYVTDSPLLLGRVTFAGATENVGDALNAMDVFVLPSHSEGMSNTLLEAMSCGLPVVATRVGGSPEVIEENHSGLLFAAGSVAELSKCLELLAENAKVRDQLGEMGRSRVLAKFSLERMVDRYSELYLEVALKAALHSKGRT